MYVSSGTSEKVIQERLRVVKENANFEMKLPRFFIHHTGHTAPESNRLVQKVQKSKSFYRKMTLITFVQDFLEHKKLIFFIE